MNEKVIMKAAPFGMDLAFNIYYLAAPLLLIQLKANPVELGLVGTITSSVHMAMSHFMGHLSDRLGRRRLIIAAPLIFATSCLFVTLAGRVGVILALSALNGFAMSIYWPSLEAWVADRQTGSELARNIGSFNLSWTAATLTGPVLSGFLYNLYPRLTFLLAAAVALMLFILIYTSLQDTEPHSIESVEPTGGEASTPRKDLLYAVWVANFASWFLIGNARYQFPKLARELGLPPYVIGLLLGCVGFSLFSGFFILRGTHLWHFKKRYLFGAQLLAALGLVFLFLSSEPVLLALAFLMIGLSCSVTYYSSLYYTVHLLEKKGKGTGLHESILGIGAVLGPILGGIAAQYTGLRAPYLLCFAVLFAAVVAELTLTIKRNDKGQYS
jgi:DHA1 family multidrug resistance protein-like MFS transporter